MSRSRSSSGYLPPGELYVYADSVCRSKVDGEFGGYGIYAPLHSVRIAEPLPGSVQTMEKGELQALHAALELVHGLRARIAIVYMHSNYVVEGYEQHLRSWEANHWRTDNGRPIRNRTLWCEIWDLYNLFLDRGVDVTVHLRQRNSDHNMRTANRLACHGATMHVTCELCRKTHGRQWGNHGCEPICDLDRCNGRVLKNVYSYMKHMKRRHQKKCRRKDCELGFNTFVQEELDEHEREVHGGLVFDCEFCGDYFKSPRRVKRHIRSSCRQAPYCTDCGRLFKSKTELERHNAHRGSDSESSSESDGIATLGVGDDHGVLDDEVNIDLDRHDFGPTEFVHRSRRHGRVGRHYIHDEHGDEYVGAGADDDSDSYSSSSSSETEGHRGHRRKCRRHGDHHEGSKHGRRHRHRGSRHKRRHRHGKRYVMTDREGRHWDVDDLGIHRRHDRPDTGAQFDTKWYRVRGGGGSE